MRSSAVEINIRHWNPVIFECSKTDWQNSLELLRSAWEAEADPDIQSFTSILNAASRVASWSLALAVLAAMLSSSVQAGVAAYNIAISSCKSHWILAPQLLDKLTSHGLLPDVITQSTATAVMTAGEGHLECGTAALQRNPEGRHMLWSHGGSPQQLLARCPADLSRPFPVWAKGEPPNLECHDLCRQPFA